MTFQVVKLSDEEQIKLYMKSTKKELATMLLQCNKLIDIFVKSSKFYENSEMAVERTYSPTALRSVDVPLEGGQACLEEEGFVTTERTYDGVTYKITQLKSFAEPIPAVNYEMKETNETRRWLAVNEDGSEFGFTEIPHRQENKRWGVPLHDGISSLCYMLPINFIQNHFGKKLTWADEPLCINEEEIITKEELDRREQRARDLLKSIKED